MSNRIRRAAAIFMAFVVMVLAIPGMGLTAYAATGKITFSDPTVTVGNQVSVTMKITSSDGLGLGASDVRLQYDSSALEFISGTNANGGAGSVRVIGALEAENQTTFSFTLKFKALKAGNSAITVTSQEVYDADSKTVQIEHVGSSAVKITAPETYSKEASLESLTISPGELTPAFSADVTEYNAIVGGDVDQIAVSAPAKDGKASVSVSGNEGLQVGENTITCKVTAEDGTTTKTYTILVTKTEGEAETEETPAETETGSSGAGQNVMEGNWTAEETFDVSILPEGFKVTEFVYDGVNVQAGSDEQGSILLYMTNENGESDFFLYDQNSGVLAPYVTVEMAEKSIIVLPPEAMPEDIILPEQFAECTIDIGSHTVKGWIWKDDSQDAPEYCVVYGRNRDGESSLYRYDQKEMTLQRYFQDPESEALRTKYEAVAKDYNSLLEDYKQRGWIIAGVSAAAAILLIILIVVIVLEKTKKTEKIEQFDELDEFVPTERRRAQYTTKRAEEEPQPAELEEDMIELTDLDEEEPEKKPETEEEDDDFEFIDLDL